jgi:hypothetical protein
MGGMRVGWTCALALVFGCLMGCGAPVGVKRVSPREVHRELTGNALTRGSPSEITRNVLRRHDLLEAFDRDPDQALARLHAIAVGESGGRRELFALAEVSFLRAEETGRRDRYLAAAVCVCVASELVVRSGHSTQSEPETIQE